MLYNRNNTYPEKQKFPIDMFYSIQSEAGCARSLIKIINESSPHCFLFYKAKLDRTLTSRIHFPQLIKSS